MTLRWNIWKAIYERPREAAELAEMFGTSEGCVRATISRITGAKKEIRLWSCTEKPPEAQWDGRPNNRNGQPLSLAGCHFFGRVIKSGQLVEIDQIIINLE